MQLRFIWLPIRLFAASVMKMKLLNVTAVIKDFFSKSVALMATLRFAEDVAMIRVAGQDLEDEDESDGMIGGTLGSFLGKLKDTQIINAAEYKM